MPALTVLLRQLIVLLAGWYGAWHIEYIPQYRQALWTGREGQSLTVEDDVPYTDEEHEEDGDYGEGWFPDTHGLGEFHGRCTVRKSVEWNVGDSGSKSPRYIKYKYRAKS